MPISLPSDADGVPGLLILAAAGGYLFLRYTNWTRYKIHRETGYHLIFLTVAVTAFLYIIAYNITGRSTAIFTTFLLGVVLPPLINLIGSVFDFNKLYFTKRAALQSGSYIEAIFTEAFTSTELKLVEITLKNRKTYVGIVYNQELVEPQIRRSAVALIPVASGYRDKDTLELEFTTTYFSVLEDPEKYKDWEVAVPMSEIVSARIFNLDQRRENNQ